MKRSELKSYIKEQILSTLGEDNTVSENKFLRASMEDLEQVIGNIAHTGEISEDEAIELAIKKLKAMLDGRDDLDEAGDGKIDTFQVDKTDRAAVDAAKKAADDDDVIQIGEQDDDETDKAAAKGAKKVVGKSKRLDAKIKALKSIEADMKSILNKYKKAEGEEKDKFKDQLKSKTALKKETEKEIERLEREMV